MWRLLLLLVTFSLAAEPPSLEEDTTLYHQVHVISGHLNLHFCDVQVKGAAPLSLERTYCSAGALERDPENRDLEFQAFRKGWYLQGGWSLLPHTNLYFLINTSQSAFVAYLSEPNGTRLCYHYFKNPEKKKNCIYLKPTDTPSQMSGSLGARNNLKNYLLEWNTEQDIMTLYLPNGGKRIYESPPAKERGYLQEIWWLKREILPNQQQKVYYYDKFHNLTKVELKNPSDTKTFSWISFTYIPEPPKGKEFQIYIQTSDQQELRYYSLYHERRKYLKEVQKKHHPTQSYCFIPGRKGIGARIKKFFGGEKLFFEANYIYPKSIYEERKWARKPPKKDLFLDRVNGVAAPLGVNGEMRPLAQFSYEQGKTEIRNEQGLLLRYYYEEDRLLSIESYEENDRLYSYQKFFWKNGRLHTKALFDANHEPLFAKTFHYDEAGNVLKEILLGNFSGEGPPLSLNDQGELLQGESYHKTFTYQKDTHLLLSVEEEEGPIYRYEYLPGTDLLTAKWTYEGTALVKREFFYYDSDHLPIREIVDNGKSPHADDLSGITYRWMTTYLRDPNTGMVQEKIESYLDPEQLQEHLLRKTAFTYSAQNQVIEEAVWDAEENYRYSCYTEYDKQGRVVTQTNPLGQKNTYQYDAWGRILQSKEVGSPTQKFTYDAAGRKTQMEEVETGAFTKIFYDTHGRAYQQVNEQNHILSQSYDAFGRCLQTSFPQCLDEQGELYTPSLSFSYDSQGNVISTKMPLGEEEITRYNSLHQPIFIQQTDKTYLKHRYSKKGNLIQTLYPDGSKECYTYDAFSHLIEKSLYEASGEMVRQEKWEYDAFFLLSHTDRRGLKTYFSYDGAGRKVAEEAEGQRKTFFYDALGFLERVEDGVSAKGKKQDVLGRTLQEWVELADGSKENEMHFFYDEENRKIEAVRFTSQGEAHDFFAYDTKGRLISHTTPEQVFQWTYEAFHYNELGQFVNQTRKIDPLGNQTLETKDVQDRTISVEKQDPQGNTVFYERFFYDRSGNRAKRISTVYKDFQPIRELIDTWRYDAKGRILSQSHGKKVTTFAYDERGRMREKTTPSGITFLYHYDADGRLLSRKSSDETVHDTYAYALGPEPIFLQDHIHGYSLHRSYNVWGQLLSEKGHIELAWSYDRKGRIDTFTLPDSSSIHYTYQQGHLASVQRKDIQGELCYQHSYDEFNLNGQIVRETFFGKLGERKHAYDLLERPLSQATSSHTQSVQYNPLGLIASWQSSFLGSKEYDYDALQQLTQENEKKYHFDSLGNPSHLEVNETNEFFITDEAALFYSRDGNPQEIQREGEKLSLRYDALGRLIQMYWGQEKKIRYFYDPLSRLVAKETIQEDHYEKIWYLYDQETEIGTLSNEGEILELKVLGLGIQGEIGAAVAIELKGQVFCPLHDFQGNVILLLSSQGEIVESYPRDAFGKETLSKPAINPWRFSSKRAEEEFFFFGGRFYSPRLGRWLTPDPLGFIEGANLYLYARNSPTSRLDLFGFASTWNPGFQPFPILTPAYFPVPVLSIKDCISDQTNLVDFHLSENGVPVNYLVYSSHWDKIQFTPQETENGYINLVQRFPDLCSGITKGVGFLPMAMG